MRILFIHPNFPGQFRHLATHLAGMPEHTVVGLGDEAALNVPENALPGVRRIGYRLTRAAHPETHAYLRGLEDHVLRGQAAVRACRALQSQGFTPELIISHTGWGDALYLRDVFPRARIVGYCEFYYHAEGTDVGFDPEFPPDEDSPFRLRTRNATQLLSWSGLDAGWSPSAWQKSLFPAEYRDRITVIPDGVDTRAVRPDPQADFFLPGGQRLTRADEVLTLTNRHLEPYRGLHRFLRALPAIQRARPHAVTLVVGDDRPGYGPAAPNGLSWRETLLREQGERLDLSRIHFLGPLAYADYLRVLRVSRAHVYLTYPFVLSWSMLEAMACGCTLLASATPPVTEVIRDGVNGRLFDFFNTGQLAALCAETLATPERFAGLGHEARRTIREHHDLRDIALPRQVDFLNRLMSS